MKTARSDGIAGRQAGGQLPGVPLARRQRDLGGRRRARRHRQAAGRTAQRARDRGLQSGQAGVGRLHRVDARALRGRHPRRAGGVAVPARLARDVRLGRGAAAVDHPHLCRHAGAGLHAQRRHAAGAHAGGRHPGRRCHRGGGEHRAPSAQRQAAVRGCAGSRAGDRAGGDRHVADTDGHRHQELDPAGGVRHRGAARPRHVAHRGPDRRVPQARARS